MKKIILITILITGLTVAYSHAQMGRGHMMDSQSYEEARERGYMPHGRGGMMGYGGYGMMGPGHMGGMMGYGMGPCMMGQGMGHMGGYGMMGPGHMGGMMGYGGYGMRGYDPEAYQKYQDEYQKYLDNTAALRKKLHDKKFDYFEALRRGDTKGETILKLEKEIRDLQWDIYEKAPR